MLSKPLPIILYTLHQALRVLSKPDVVVTNMSDKTTQLRKLAQLDALVRRTLAA